MFDFVVVGRESILLTLKVPPKKHSTDETNRVEPAEKVLQHLFARDAEYFSKQSQHIERIVLQTLDVPQSTSFHWLTEVPLRSFHWVLLLASFHWVPDPKFRTKHQLEHRLNSS